MALRQKRLRWMGQFFRRVFKPPFFIRPFIGVIYTPFITIGLGPTLFFQTKDKFGASQLTRESKTPKNSVSKVRQLSKTKVTEEEFPRKI